MVYSLKCLVSQDVVVYLILGFRNVRLIVKAKIWFNPNAPGHYFVVKVKGP